MTTCLVTGAAGFIGSHITDALCNRGDDIIALDSFETGCRENLSHLEGKVRLAEVDIRDTARLTELMKGIDAVFHQAALPSVPLSVAEPVLLNDINVNGTLSVLVAARDAGVRRVVYAASSAAYGDLPTLPKVETMKPDPLSPYAAQKLMGEYYCTLFTRVYGLEAVSLRYFNVFGPRQDPDSQYAAAIPKFISLLGVDKPLTIFGDGEQTRDFIYVTDVVKANLLAADAKDAPGKVINAASGMRVTVNELVSTIARIMGKDVSPVYAPARKGDVMHSHADITLAKEVLGFEPEVTLEEGLQKTVEYFA